MGDVEPAEMEEGEGGDAEAFLAGLEDEIIRDGLDGGDSIADTDNPRTMSSGKRKRAEDMQGGR